MALKASVSMLLLLLGIYSVRGRRVMQVSSRLVNTGDSEVSRGSVTAFHLNLAWECGALPPFGSGKYASYHCKPGSLTEVEGELHWEGTDSEKNTWANPIGTDWQEGKEPWQSLVSSCTHTFLKKLAEWKQAKSYDVLTMVEMANPGVEGLVHLGRSRETLPELNGRQQISPIVYEYLSKNILKDYDVFGNVLVDRNVVIQATYWKRSTYSSPTVAVGLNMMESKESRPISALFFEREKTLILNIHSVHFRKILINSPEAFGQRIFAYGDEDETLKFGNGGILAFNTEQLQELYGTLLTDKIVEALEQCASGSNVTTGLHCQGNVEDLIDSPRKKLASKLRTEDWTIIAGGDFNDETMELSQFKLFGISVGVRDEDRKRTCCSDRDRDFKRVQDGKEDPNDVQSAVLDYKVRAENHSPSLHTIANLDYMVKDCKYLEGAIEGNLSFDAREGLRNELQSYIITTLQKNPMSLPGATKVLADGTIGKSFSPFSSDMIISNREGGAIEFPPKYKQRMSQRTKNDPDNYEVFGGGYDGMISDHDPIERVIYLQ